MCIRDSIQVVITLAGFWNSAEAAVSLSGYVSELFHLSQFSYGKSVSVFIVTVLLSFFTLVLGELVPKRIAMIHADGMAMAVVKPILVISKVLKPFLWLISVSVTVVLKICRQKTDVVDLSLIHILEPGIYIPDKFGVRIEDLAIITEFGIINAVKSQKSLIII